MLFELRDCLSGRIYEVPLSIMAGLKKVLKDGIVECTRMKFSFHWSGILYGGLRHQAIWCLNSSPQWKMSYELLWDWTYNLATPPRTLLLLLQYYNMICLVCRKTRVTASQRFGCGVFQVVHWEYTSIGKSYKENNFKYILSES